MKIAIGTPSLDDPRGIPQFLANRQAQFFVHGASIFPPLLANAATMAQQAGHAVLWADGPALRLTWAQYLAMLNRFQPDWVLWETKTPGIKRTWRCVNQLKELLPETSVILCGDHVTALPEETVRNSLTDVVLTGGDYDFGLLDLLNGRHKVAATASQTHQVGAETVIPATIAGKTPQSLSTRENAPYRIYAKKTDTPLTDLPIPHRALAQWWRYAYAGSGNYKYLPGTHSYFGRDCWWRHEGGCTFCSWTNTYKNFRVVSVDRAMAEVEACASMGIREIFDDTGTFPIGAWLYEFCAELRKFNHGKCHGKARITLGCNMRPGALTHDEWQMLGASGFRFILFGLESANQNTIVHINKGQADGDIERSCRDATRAGLEPHATCMIGYPWETKSDAQNTIALTKALFHRGWLKTLQATIIIPYPGTALFRQAQEQGWLKYGDDWAQYDMRKPVMTCPMTDTEVLQLVRSVYTSYFTPQNLLRQLRELATLDGRRFLWRGAQYFLGHLRDFAGGAV